VICSMPGSERRRPVSKAILGRAAPGTARLNIPSHAPRKERSAVTQCFDPASASSRNAIAGQRDAHRTALPKLVGTSAFISDPCSSRIADGPDQSERSQDPTRLANTSMWSSGRHRCGGRPAWLKIERGLGVPFVGSTSSTMRPERSRVQV